MLAEVGSHNDPGQPRRVLQTAHIAPGPTGRSSASTMPLATEWADARPFTSNAEREAALQAWLDDCNLDGAHLRIDGKTRRPNQQRSRSVQLASRQFGFQRSEGFSQTTDVIERSAPDLSLCWSAKSYPFAHCMNEIDGWILSNIVFRRPRAEFPLPMPFLEVLIVPKYL